MDDSLQILIVDDSEDDAHLGARNFGFLHPNSKRLMGLLQLLLRLDPNRALAWMKKRPQWVCPACGAKMKIIETRLPPLFSFSRRLLTG